HHTSEGGIATPFILSWPKGISDQLYGKILPFQGHVIDIMPTCIDIANGRYPTQYKGNDILPMEGMSFLPLMLGKSMDRSTPLYWEHEGNRAMLNGEWKIVSNVKEPWQLYNLRTDRTETKNVAQENPEIVSSMVAKYNIWAEKVGVIPYNFPPKPWQTMQRGTVVPSGD